MSAITFVRPLLGLDELADCTLDPVEGAEGVYAIRSASSATRLYVLNAAVHLPTYQPTITDAQVASIRLEHAESAAVLVVVNPGDGVATVNLIAPIVVNLATGEAVQLILEDQPWPVKLPLSEALGS